MTFDEFKVFRRELCAPEGTDQPAGYYPAMPFGDRMAMLWFQYLQRFSLLQCLRALEQYAAAEPLRVPALDAIVERVKALHPPPPVQSWFAQTQVDAMREDGYGGVLHSLLPPEGAHAWVKCWIWLFDQGFTRPGREAACAQECRTLATQYPEDRARWEQEAVRLEAAAQEVPQRAMGSAVRHG